MPNSDSKTYIVNDQPTETDALDFTPYVETLADIIQTGNTPLTIGVFGTWGSGKTSLMKMIKNGITKSDYKGLPNDYTVVWFDAWKYDKEETLWRVLLLSVLAKVKETAKSKNEPLDALERLETMLYRAVDIEKVGGVKIDLLKLGGLFAKGTVQLGLSFIPGGAVLGKFVEEVQKSGTKALTDDFTQAIQRERTKIHIEQVRFLEQFQDKFNELIKQFIKPNRLVVFVDDLDRCLPDKAIEVLEAIKLFLDVESCIFVLGLDQEVIARGIEVKYKELGVKQDGDSQEKFTIEGARYLEKIIQLPFQIPPVEQNDMGDFVKELSSDWPDDECPKVFSVGLGDNPRQIKRTVNVFLMLWKLAERRKEKLEDRIKPIRLAKVVTIQAAYPELYNLLLKDEPRYLRELEEYYRGEFAAPIVDTDGEVTDFEVASNVQVSPTLKPFLSRRGASATRRILTLHDPEIQGANFLGLLPDELKLYFTLTRRVETSQSTSFGTPLVFSEPQMVQIPAGNFLRGSTNEQIARFIEEGADPDLAQNETPQHTVELSEYFIGKYLITNREYQVFVRDAKYNPPRSWDGDQFPTEKGDHPVTDIAWQDAIAYCDWLGSKTNKHYRLPTESEWEKAARGTDGRIYPWGDTFDTQKCNVLESKIGATTPVGQYSPKGDSLNGCSDMIGNVWQWCNDWFDANEYKNLPGIPKNPTGPISGQNHVRKGGAYDSSYRKDVRCAYRNRYSPTSLDGFRVAYSSVDFKDNQ